MLYKQNPGFSLDKYLDEYKSVVEKFYGHRIRYQFEISSSIRADEIAQKIRDYAASHELEYTADELESFSENRIQVYTFNDNDKEYLVVGSRVFADKAADKVQEEVRQVAKYAYQTLKELGILVERAQAEHAL